jgi:ElaB/YqjD/DUF883 family membrane-anchored ribosome-binding protein
MPTDTIQISKAEHDKVRAELSAVRNENARLIEKARKAEDKAAKATKAKASVDQALKDTRQQLNDAAREIRTIGAPLIAREDGEVFLVLKQAMHLGDRVHPLGTPVARVQLLNGASINYVVDSYRSGYVTDRQPTSVAAEASPGGDGEGSGIGE